MTTLFRFALTFLITALVGTLALAQEAADYRMLKDGNLTAFEDGVTPRAGVRANFYRGSGDDPWANSPGQVAIEYGLPVWKEEYDRLFENFPVGKQWRLGSNFWTNLWTSFPLTSEETGIDAGFYFLALERTGEKSWSLVIFEPAEATKAGMDPWHVGRKDPVHGLKLPLHWQKQTDLKEKLEITIQVNETALQQLAVHIRFGGHHFWTSPIQVVF